MEAEREAGGEEEDYALLVLLLHVQVIMGLGSGGDWPSVVVEKEGIQDNNLGQAAGPAKQKPVSVCLSVCGEVDNGDVSRGRLSHSRNTGAVCGADLSPFPCMLSRTAPRFQFTRSVRERERESVKRR